MHSWNLWHQSWHETRLEIESSFSMTHLWPLPRCHVSCLPEVLQNNLIVHVCVLAFWGIVQPQNVFFYSLYSPQPWICGYIFWFCQIDIPNPKPIIWGRAIAIIALITYCNIIISSRSGETYRTNRGSCQMATRTLFCTKYCVNVFFVFC